MHKAYLLLALICSSLLSAMAGDLTVVVAVKGADEVTLTQALDGWRSTDLNIWCANASVQALPSSNCSSSTAALATILTGVSAAEHGICDEYVFDREKRQPVDLFQSESAMGIASKASYNCEALLSPTASDKLRMQKGASPRIYAVGIESSTTLLLAGHAANACCWIERNEQANEAHWASTSYYREGLPSAADRMNMSGEVDRLLKRKNGRDAAVIELALAIQSEKQLGVKQLVGSQDVLLLQMEQVSTVRGLMETLLHRMGKDYLHLIVIGVPASVSVADQMMWNEWNMPVKSWDIDRAVALTSSYLMALYGYERWLEGGYGNSLYLNRELIAEKKLSLGTMQREVAQFLMEFDGVRYACPLSEAYLQPDMREGIHKRCAGDVVFDLQANYKPRYTTGAILMVNPGEVKM